MDRDRELCTKAPVRMLDFADFTWSVKRRDFPAGPGGNFFSDRAEDVWVDEEGLHMTVTMRDGDWYASEVILNSSLGYGTYIFQTRGRVDVHDPNLVAAGFLWDGEAPPSFRELDFEFTRWSLPQQPTNAQFVVQPCNQCPGCGDNCERFTVNLADGESDLTHYLILSEGSVEFRTYLGEHRDRSPPASDLVHKWVHSGEDVPEPGNTAWRFNYWLNDAQPPDNGVDARFVVTDFAYQKDPPVFDDGQVVTNLPTYPLAGSFEAATDVQTERVRSIA